MKGRTTKTYNHKINRMTKKWKESPNIQKRFTLEEWLSKIRKPNCEGKKKSSRISSILSGERKKGTWGIH